MNAMTPVFDSVETKEKAVDRFLLSETAILASHLSDAMCQKVAEDVNFIRPDGSRDNDMDQVCAIAEVLKVLIGDVRVLCEQAEVNGLQ